MRKRNGVHLVMPGKMGPITVFFMPGEMADAEHAGKLDTLQRPDLPTSWGSIAVVGESGESLDGLGERLAAAVPGRSRTWRNQVSLGRGALAPAITQQQDS